ncbi:MAG: P-loop NTPase fold protein [Gaiellaceae bacterium]
MNSSNVPEARLREGDLIPDHALTERERDEFKHTEIAERVAELVTTAEPPLNVALFGSWGSGKSSFATLLKKALAAHQMKTVVIVYDAWKYSGDALQRTFIAETADQLGIDDEYFTSQLAQAVEKEQVDLKQSSGRQTKAHLKWVWHSLVPVFAAVVASVLGIIALASWAANRSVSREFLSHAWLWGVPFLVAFLGAVVKPIADTAKMRVTEGPPSEEAFEKRFKALLRRAAKQKGYDRFIFFIDELDRVAPKDVIATLSVVKNFLGQKNAVFVVAADKQVLEHAFKRLPQATPTNEDEPYYSSASEFLDKIFQYQLALPPLRGSSLFRFAHDLVTDRADGVWAELKATDADGRLLDGVLYVLIPSHVRSPRRVKVLLNNFATNARIAQARGVDWLGRSREIAKLTVFQTEFPLLAADLDLEPRLPTLLLDSAGYVLSERTRRLLERHAVAEKPTTALDEGNAAARADATAAATAQTPGVPDAPDELAGATDTLIVSATDQPKLVGVQRENLRRYLTRTQDVPNPSRQLLFLEPGGSAEGLSDPELGELLEAEAIDNPAAVLTAARGRTREEQQAIIRVLAGMSEQAYAEERSNIITALLDVVRLVDLDLGASLGPAASAVGAFARLQGLQERQLTGALRVGIAADRAGGDASLRDTVLADQRLLTDVNRIRAVADLLDDLPPEAAARSQEAVGEYLDTTSDVLTEPLRLVSPQAAEALIKAVRAPLQKLIEGAVLDDATTLIADLFDALDDRTTDAPEARLELMWTLELAGTDVAYGAVAEHADAALTASGTSQIANSVALKALGAAPAGHWQLWMRWLDESAAKYDAQKQMAELALIRIAGLLPQAEEDQIETARTLTMKVVAVAGLLDDDISAPLTTTVQGALETLAWWSGGGDFLRHEKIHRLVRDLAPAIGASTASTWADLRYADLVRGISNAGLVAIVFQAVADWIDDLKAEQLRDLATRLSTAPLSGDQTTDVELVAARTELWIQARAAKEDVSAAPYTITFDQIAAATKPVTARAEHVFRSWFLRARLSPADVLKLIPLIGRSPTPGEAETLREWLTGLSSASQRTEFLTGLTESSGEQLEWIRAAVSTTTRDYAEEVVAHAVASDAMKASRSEERRSAVDKLLALNPSTSASQAVVGELVVWLLERNQKVDFDIALVAVSGLGQSHGMGRKIGDAFRKACEQLGRKIPAGDKPRFEQARIVLAQSYFERPKKKGLKGMLRR